MCSLGAAWMGEGLCIWVVSKIVEVSANVDSRGGGRKSRGGVYDEGFEGPATAFGKSPFMRPLRRGGGS